MHLQFIHISRQAEHVPKINGETPSADDEISDHQRMLDRLQLYGLVENTVQGDGNCQVRRQSRFNYERCMWAWQGNCL